MNDNFGRAVLKKKLRDKVEKQLKNRVLQTRIAHCELYEQYIKQLSAISKKHTQWPELRKALNDFLQRLDPGKNANQRDRIVEEYEDAVKRIATSLPEEVILSQSDSRFIPQSEDSWFIKIAKTGKRILRDLSYLFHELKSSIAGIFGITVAGWKQWEQKISPGDVVSYHLFDQQTLVKKWIDFDENFQVKLINELQEWLVRSCRIHSFGNSLLEEPDLKVLVDKLQDKYEDHRNELEVNIDKQFKDITNTVLNRIEKVGTIERSGSFYSKNRIAEKNEQLKTIGKQRVADWDLIEKQLLDRVSTILEFLDFRGELEQKGRQFLKNIHAHFKDVFIDPFNLLERSLVEAISEFEENDAVSTERINAVKSELSSFLALELIDPIRKKSEQKVVPRMFDHLAEDLLMRSNEVSQKAVFVYDLELEKRSAAAKSKEIEWRLFLVRGLKDKFVNLLEPKVSEYQSIEEIQHSELVEIKEIIEVNLGSAAEESAQESEPGDLPADIAREALERTLLKVKELREIVIQCSQDIEDTLVNGGREFTESVLLLLHEGDQQQLQRMDARYRVKETTKDWQTRIGIRWAQAKDALALMARFAGKKAKEYAKAIRQFFGFEREIVREKQKTDIASYLSETDQKIKELPYIYRRLFDFEAGADDRFYIPVDSKLGSFKNVWQRWDDGFPATLAIVGEKGSGKSTYLNLAAQKIQQDEFTVKIVLDQTIWTEEQLINKLGTSLGCDSKNIDELIAWIKQNNEIKTIMVDCFQNLYVRHIRGYDAIEKMVYLISETKDHIFWVISCSRYAWNFLDETHSLSEYFSHIVRTDSLNADQIESVIMSRHRSSGYDLHFEPGKPMLQSRSYLKLLDREDKAQDYLRKNFFEELTELADGNASIAMIFWIRSIKSFDDTHFYIHPLEITSVAMIEDLNVDVLFTLAALVLHDTLKPEELSMVLDLSKEESRLMLTRLKTRGLLEEKDGQYVLNHLVYRQIVRVLKSRNIIHLV